MMSSGEPTTIGIDYPTRADRRTHIERIDPLPNDESPSWLPRASQYHAPASSPELEPAAEPIAASERKPYMLLEQAYMHGAIVRAGETVWLCDHEVGPYHVPVEIADDGEKEEAGEEISPQEK